MDENIKRKIANIIPGEKELENLINSDKKLNIYFGIDPTATNIHLGHAVSIRVLNEFAKKNHNVTFLIGDFTALIGDSSDKESERPVLSKKEIEANFATYKQQAEKILDFSNISVRFNSEWNKKLSFEELLKLTGTFSLNDFISRELIKKRLNEGKKVGLSEAFYPLIQAYDSYNLKTDIQIGGTDQTFNMQAGRTLIKNKEKRDSFVITTKFLMGTDGRKMSKSWGNAIWLTDDPFEVFRKVMAIDDNQIKNYFELATDLDKDQIPNKEEIENNPLIVKKKLALEITTQLHNKIEAEKAKSEFERVVQKGGTPADLPVIKVIEDTPIDDEFLTQHGLSESKSDAKRLFEQNGVSVNEIKVKNGEEIAGEKGEEIILRIGKKMVRLRVE